MDRFRWIKKSVGCLVVMPIVPATLTSCRPAAPAVLRDADGVKKDDENHLWHLIRQRHMSHEAAVAQVKAEEAMVDHEQDDMSEEDKRRSAFEREQHEQEIQSVLAASCKRAPWQNRCQ